MKVIRETIIAGRTIFRSVKASTRIATKEGKRAPKMNPTSEAVQKVNDRIAEKELAIKINHNFAPGDHHVVLTHGEQYGDEPGKLPLPSPEEAKGHLRKFIRKLRDEMKKDGIVFKWIAVTEYEHDRIHHHIVCNDYPLEKIAKCWPHGKVRVTLPGLDETGNYYKLAAYLIKETKKSFRKEGSPTKRRYGSSRSIIMPEVKREVVSERELRKDPKELNGYYIDQDTVRRYEHAITGAECMEFIMVSLEEKPRIKKWRKGKTVKRRERYMPIVEEQLSLSECVL